MKILLLCVLLLSCGCSFFKEKAEEPKPPRQPIRSYEIFDRNPLSKGHKFLIEPFAAGENVSATEELDKLALKMIQGINEIFANQNSSPYEVVGSDQAQNADFLMRGHFTSMSRPGDIKKLFFQQRQNLLAVEGEIVDIKSGEGIARFQHQRRNLEPDNFYDLALALGEDIGTFLMSLKGREE